MPFIIIFLGEGIKHSKHLRFPKKPGGEKILIDVKGIYDSKALTDAGFRIWRL
jgi:hypothetical protein